MFKSNPFNWTIASALFLLFLVLGCGEAESPQTKPVVVKKRITEKTLPEKPEKAGGAAVEKADAVPLATEKKVADSTLEPKEDSTASSRRPMVSPEEKQDTPSSESSPEISLSDKIVGASPRYDPAGKIDPFEPLFKETPSVIASTETKYKRRRPLTPLEKIDVSQLKLMGVIRAESGNRALLVDATGKGYIVTTGTYVGINGGRVVEIEKQSAFIEEEVEDIFGKITVSRQELKLQKPAGEE